MTENDNKKIGFILEKITTEQFAIIEEGFSEKGNIRIGTSFRFGCDDEKKLIACFTSFNFESEKKTFMIIEAGCHFRIKDDAWSDMYSAESKTVKAHRGFLSHLAMLTVGTTRGILHAKTEGTNFNKYVLPTIDVTKIVKEDVTFDFNLLKPTD